MNRWNLEQVLEINGKVFNASLLPVSDMEEMLQREEDTLKEIPRQIVGSAFDAVNELLSIDRLSIAVYNETTHKLEYTSNPVEDTAVDELLSGGNIWRIALSSKSTYRKRVYKHCRLLWMREICVVA